MSRKNKVARCLEYSHEILRMQIRPHKVREPLVSFLNLRNMSRGAASKLHVNLNCPRAIQRKCKKLTSFQGKLSKIFLKKYLTNKIIFFIHRNLCWGSKKDSNKFRTIIFCPTWKCHKKIKNPVTRRTRIPNWRRFQNEESKRWLGLQNRIEKSYSHLSESKFEKIQILSLFLF